MNDIAIRAENIGKRYQLGNRAPYATLRETVTRAFAAPFVGSGDPRSEEQGGSIWALREVSFDVARGEVLGVIGQNGAGKSTLLKILARITVPTEGSAVIHGRVGSLLEVGTGFHSELTGRENVYLSGAILGMRRVEIEAAFDEIVAFSGVERFVDTPVKHFSSGMYLRLAFSVTAHLQTEILLVDEVLAVGDAAFQLKCLEKMSEVAGSGKTILFVSHNLEAVSKLCDRAIWLQAGRVRAVGTPQECIERYLFDEGERGRRTGREISLRVRAGGRQPEGPVQLLALTILDESGAPATTVRSGGPVAIVLTYELASRARPQTVMFAITFSNVFNQRIASCRSHDTYLKPIRVDGPGRALCRIPRLPLAPGSYRLSVGCLTEAGASDGVDDAATIEVVGNGFYPSGLVPNRTHGEVLFDHEWELLPAPEREET